VRVRVLVRVEGLVWGVGGGAYLSTQSFSSNDPLQEGIDKALPIVIDRLRQAA
jgi:hypothetical protein